MIGMIGISLPFQCRIQCRHSRLDFLNIARCVGRFQSIGGIQDQPVVRRHVGRRGLLTSHCLAAKSLVNGFAESFPHFLLNAAIHGHALGFSLPALLQSFDRIDPQHGRSAKLLGLSDQSLTAFGAGFLSRFQRCRSTAQSLLPQRLQFCKCFLTQMARRAPTVAKLVK